MTAISRDREPPRSFAESVQVAESYRFGRGIGVILLPAHAYYSLDEKLVLGGGQHRSSAVQNGVEERPESDGGDMSAYIDLLGQHDRQVFRYVYSLTANWDDAEEVMQRVRIRIWEQFHLYDREKSFGAWARAIAYYLVLAYRKEKSRRVFSERVLALLRDTFEDEAEDVDARHSAMLECLGRLPDSQRKLINDYYSRDGSTESMAKEMGVAVSALRQKVYRIRKKLLGCIQLGLQGQ